MLDLEHATIERLKPFVVSRQDMPSIHHVKINGEYNFLGQLKDFRKVVEIQEFMPEEGRCSLSWVSLNAGEELKTHEHPIESMIVITSGHAQVTGDISCKVKEGDIVCVPRNTKHGFIGEGDKGFWGISIQFEARGLYEDHDNALVKFDLRDDYMAKLLIRHNILKQDIKSHTLFNAIKSEDEKRAFLRVFKYWSETFQQLVLIRTLMVSDPKFIPVTNQHLDEEFGHSRAFDHLEYFTPSLNMQAVCSWFREKMTKIDDEQRVVFMNLAIEGSATVFYEKFYCLFSDCDESTHFKLHQNLDHEHEGLGLRLININTDEKYLSLLLLLDDTWKMISALYTAIEEDIKLLIP